MAVFVVKVGALSVLLRKAVRGTIRMIDDKISRIHRKSERENSSNASKDEREVSVGGSSKRSSIDIPDTNQESSALQDAS